MKRLSSLILTLYALGILVLCLLVGMILTQAAPYSQAMRAMDHGLILDWLVERFAAGQGASLPVVWFLALCGAVGLLVLNLFACTWTRLIPRLKNSARFHAWLLLAAHVLIALVLLGHLSQMTLGYKLEGVKLLAGQSRELPDGLSLRVERVQFVNDLEQLKPVPRNSCAVPVRRPFDCRNNLVQVSLWRGAQRVDGGELRVMEPLTTPDLRLTLAKFYLDDSEAEPRVGGVFTASHNPLTYVFFTAYLAWIAVYLLLTLQAFVRKENSHADA